MQFDNLSADLTTSSSNKNLILSSKTWFTTSDRWCEAQLSLSMFLMVQFGLNVAIPLMGVSRLFSDVWAVTNPKSPTFTEPSSEKKILDGCEIE